MTVTAQRLWVWIFTMAFLLLSGFNGYRLIDLEGSAWVDEADTVKTLRAQLDRLSTTQEPTPVIEWHESYEPESVDAGAPAEEGREAIPDASPSADAEGVVLPVLAGIFSVVSAEGHTTFRALLDGHMKSKGERVGAFLITRISEQGVRLGNHRGHHFLANRDPLFSIDHGKTLPTP
jgi:hypothetical protein